MSSTPSTAPTVVPHASRPTVALHTNPPSGQTPAHRRFVSAFLSASLLASLLAATAFLPAVPAHALWSYAPPDAPEPSALAEQFDAALARGDTESALGIAEQIQEQREIAHIVALYNVAALYARKGDEEQAYAWLQRTLDAGFWDFGHLRRDEDFAALRQDERFEKTWRVAWSKQYIAMLEREERDDFQMPARVMEALALRPGERVADVGAGSGYFTVRFARAVGPEGSVLATDIRPEMLDFLGNRLAEEDLHNVELKLTEKDDPGLPEAALDTIILVDVWHYIRDPSFAVKLARGLAPGGRIVVIDYRPKPFEERPWGPPPVQQTPREELDAHFAEAGLAPIESFDFLPEQYFVVYGMR